MRKQIREDQVDYILSKMLGNEASSEQLEELEHWRNASEENNLIYQYVTDLKNKEAKPVQGESINPKFDHLWLKAKNNKRNPFFGFKYAAVLAFFLCAGFIVFHFLQKSQNTFLSIEYITKSTLIGQKSKIYLPDGSYVWLNSESSIRYAKEFSEGSRTVYLEGEAYFAVKSDKSKPFSVLSDDAKITVLGTRFNVNSYFQNRVDVALEEGKVRVEHLVNQSEDKELSVILHPGEMASVIKGEHEIVKSNFDAKDIFAWKRGILFFKNNNFKEIVSDLERWYGVKFIYNTPPEKDWNFSGSFKNEYLDNVLNALAFGEDFEYEIVRDTIILKFKQ